MTVISRRPYRTPAEMRVFSAAQRSVAERHNDWAAIGERIAYYCERGTTMTDAAAAEHLTREKARTCLNIYLSVAEGPWRR